MLTAFFGRRVADPNDADDLAQEVMLRLCRQWAVEPPRAPRAWLLTVARNLLADRRPPRRAVAELHEDALADEAACPLRLLVREESRAAVHEAVAGLDPVRRHTLRLCAFEGLTQSEAAAVLGCPEATVNSRMHRARALLKVRLSA